MPEIGLNIATLLPWSSFPGIDWIAQLAAVPIAEAMTNSIEGINFWQVLPLKGVTAETIKDSSAEIRYVESAWNSTTIWRHLAGKPGSTGNPTKMEDVIFFPKPKESANRVQQILESNPNATLIGHDLYPTGTEQPRLIEVNPEMGITPDQLAHNWAPSYRRYYERVFVLDTRHLRRSAGTDGWLLPEWTITFAHLLPDTCLIHIQPLNTSELQLTLGGRETELIRMLKKAIEIGYQGNYVIEVPPNLLGPGFYMRPQEMIRTLRKFRKVVEEAIT